MKKKTNAAPAMARPTIKKGILKRVIGYFLRYHKAAFFTVIICILFSSVGSISASVFLKKLIDDYITPGIAAGLDTVFWGIVRLLGVMAAVYALGLICTTIYTQLMAIIAQKILMRMRNEMFNNMESLPIRYFDTHTHGDIMSRYTNDIDAMYQLIATSIPQLVVCTITIAALLTVMLTFSLWLTFLVLLCVGVMVLISKHVGGNSVTYFIRQQQSVGKVEGFVEEMMAGQKVVKVFCHEQNAKQDFDRINDRLNEDSRQAHKYANILMPIMGNIGNMMYVLIAIVGALLVVFSVPNVSLSGISVLELGVVVSFLTMCRQFTMSVSQLSQQVNALAMGTAGAARVFALIDEAPEYDAGYVTLVNALRLPDGTLTETDHRTDLWAWKHPHTDGSVTYTEVTGDIRMFEVDFGYTDDKIVLHDISLYAEPGQKVAFVGATGAGKTTITNLINRFYDIADGKIRYDGININKIKKDDLRRSLGVVLQDTNLFTGTVMQNLRYGNPDATDEQVYAAAKLANAHDFITRLPDGYETMLSANGANLSQGQRQLLSIARAAVADAPVMILDEATSSIDTRTEALVQAGMDNLMHGRTVFVIAHRLSTVQNSDVIMVLDHGRIIEKGNHAALIAQRGVYYQLYSGAFELE